MKSCVIIGASPCKNLYFLSEDIWKNSFVIAADGGYETAISNGIQVDAFIGDLDSNGEMPGISDVTVLPCEKDYTDVHTAVNRALEEGFDKIYLAGCTNGRADHYFANVALLELIHQNGAEGIVFDECNVIRFIREGRYEFKRAAKYFSIIPLDSELFGVTLKGLKYLLEDATLRREMPVAVSNEWIEDTAVIEIKKGRALLVFSEDKRI